MNKLYYVIGLVLLANSALGAVTSCLKCAGKECYSSDGKDLEKEPCPTTLSVEKFFEPIFKNLNINTSLAAQVLQKSKFADAQDFQPVEGDIVCLNFGYSHDLIKDGPVAYRGCGIEKVFTRDICDTLENLMDLVAGDVENCNTCDENDCNSAVSLSQIPLFAVIIAAVLRLYL